MDNSRGAHIKKYKTAQVQKEGEQAQQSFYYTITVMYHTETPLTSKASKSTFPVPLHVGHSL